MHSLSLKGFAVAYLITITIASPIVDSRDALMRAGLFGEKREMLVNDKREELGYN